MGDLYNCLNDVAKGKFFRKRGANPEEILRIESIVRHASEKDKITITAYNLKTQSGTSVNFQDSHEYEEVPLEEVLKSEPITDLARTLRYSLGDYWMNLMKKIPDNRL